MVAFLVGGVLQLDDGQGQAVDEQHDVRPPFPRRFSTTVNWFTASQSLPSGPSKSRTRTCAPRIRPSASAYSTLTPSDEHPMEVAVARLQRPPRPGASAGAGRLRARRQADRDSDGRGPTAGGRAAPPRRSRCAPPSAVSGAMSEPWATVQPRGRSQSRATVSTSDSERACGVIGGSVHGAARCPDPRASGAAGPAAESSHCRVQASTVVPKRFRRTTGSCWRCETAVSIPDDNMGGESSDCQRDSGCRGVRYTPLPQESTWRVTNPTGHRGSEPGL